MTNEDVANIKEVFLTHGTSHYVISDWVIYANGEQSNALCLHPCLSLLSNVSEIMCLTADSWDLLNAKEETGRGAS